MSTKPEATPLSEREEQVLVFATQGLTDKEIARKLGISTATVLTYWMRIRQKVGGSNRAELVAAAVRRDADSVLGIKETENHQLLGEILRRMQAEQSLREAHQRLNFHFDNTPIAVIEWDSAFRVSRWSAGAENTFGWSQDEVEGKKPAEWKFVYEEDAGLVSKLAQDLTSGRLSFGHISSRNYRKDGEVLDCEWYHSALLDDDGKFVSVLSVVLDVTERNRYQRKLRESESRLQAIIDGSPMAIFLKDLDGRYILVNRACEEFVGRPRNEILGKSDDELFPKETAELFRRQESRLLESGALLEEEQTLQDEGGTRIYHAIKFLLRDADDEAVAICGINRDLTARRHAESALAQTEEILRESLRATNTGYWIWDLVKNQHHWSAEMEAIHGMNAGSFDGSVDAFVAAVHPEDLELVRAAKAEAVDQGKPFDVEFRVTGTDGRIRWISSRAHVFHGSDGKPNRMVGFSQDVTKRKDAELASERYKVLFECLPDPVFLLDAEGRILEANDAARNLLGMGGADLGSRPLVEFLSVPGVPEGASQRALEVVPSIWQGPVTLKRVDGSTVDVECHASSAGQNQKLVSMRPASADTSATSPESRAAVR